MKHIFRFPGSSFQEYLTKVRRDTQKEWEELPRPIAQAGVPDCRERQKWGEQ